MMMRISNFQVAIDINRVLRFEAVTVSADVAYAQPPRSRKMANVRFGSLADTRARIWDVRFTPQSRHCSAWASMSAKCH